MVYLHVDIEDHILFGSRDANSCTLTYCVCICVTDVSHGLCLRNNRTQILARSVVQMEEDYKAFYLLA